MLNLYWPYANINSISDQIWFMRKLCSDHCIPFTVSHQLDPISHNLVLENIDNASSSYIEHFYKKYSLKVSVIATEFLTLGNCKDDLRVNGESLHLEREYNPQVRDRFVKLHEVQQYIHSFVSLGGQPNVENYAKFFHVDHFYDFEVPEFNFLPNKIEANKYDLYFSGSLTQYRKEIIEKLKDLGFTLLIENRFVCEDLRRKQLGKCIFNLNIPQSEDWTWISTMRVLFGMRYGAFTAEYSITRDDSIAEFIIPFSNRKSLYDSFENRFQSFGTTSNSRLLNLSSEPSKFMNFIEKIKLL